MSPLTPPLFLTLTTLLLPISLSFSLKTHLHRTNLASFLLTHLAYLLAILSYTFLVLFHSSGPTFPNNGKDKVYAALSILGLTTYPTIFTCGMATVTTTTTTQYARTIQRILIPAHVLILVLQLAGTGALFTPYLNQRTTTTLAVVVGENMLRTSLAVHVCCILALGVVFGYALFRTSKSSSDFCSEEGKHWTVKLYLLLNATLTLPLLVRTLYRCVWPLAGVSHFLFFGGVTTEIGNDDTDREVVLFYVLDAGMMVYVLVAGVVAGAVMGREGMGEGMEGREGKGIED